MGLIDSEAVVLRSYDLADADRIVVFFTRNEGVVRAVAKGAKRLKSRFGAGLEPFTEINVSYHEKEGRELVSLRHVEIRRSHFALASRIETIGNLAYMTDLIMAFSPPHEPNEKLFRMLIACLEAMESEESTDALQRVLLYFEVWSLKIAGFFPEMRSCAECERKLDGEERVFLDAEGRPRCWACCKGVGTPLSSDARSELTRIQKQNPLMFATPDRRNAKRSIEELGEATRQMLRLVLEREPPRQSSLAHINFS